MIIYKKLWLTIFILLKIGDQFYNFKLPENYILQKLNFIKNHTIQPSIDRFSNLHLDLKKLYKRIIMPDGKEVNRNWL